VNAKNLEQLDFSPKASFCTIDVSFISLRKILVPVLASLESPFSVLALVKPQFELEPQYVERGGLVSSKAHQIQAVESVISFIEGKAEFIGYTESKIKGKKKGNQEYFLYLKSR
jgi:23S rRNA (cytidine1920-2'-O)/16S rRNA (cytidine1409-2'-O)-methyltransferase